MSLHDELRAYVLRCHLPGEEAGALGDDDDLIESGILDSLALMQLTLHLRERYGLRIEAAELTVENLGSIARIAAWIRNKGGQGSRPGATGSLALGAGTAWHG